MHALRREVAMTCCPDRSRLMLFLEERLYIRESESLVEHVEGCDLCVAELEHLASETPLDCGPEACSRTDDHIGALAVTFTGRSTVDYRPLIERMSSPAIKSVRTEPQF